MKQKETNELTSKELLEGALEANEIGMKTISEDLETLKLIAKTFSKEEKLASRKLEVEKEIVHYEESLIKKDAQIEILKKLLEFNETQDGNTIIEMMFRVFTNR